MKIVVLKKHYPGLDVYGPPKAWIVKDDGIRLFFPGSSTLQLARALKECVQNKDDFQTKDVGDSTVSVHVRRNDGIEHYGFYIGVKFTARWGGLKRGKSLLLRDEAEAVSLIVCLLNFSKTDAYREIVEEDKRWKAQVSTDPDRHEERRLESRRAAEEFKERNQILGRSILQSRIRRSR